jgi:hypothetical protein
VDEELPIGLQLLVLERIVAFAARENAIVALCPHTAADVARHRQLTAKLHRRDRARVRPLPLQGAAQTRWMVGAASVVVTTRYHPLVFALAAAVPAIGLHHGEYTRVRMEGALGHAGVDGFALDLEHAPAHIEEALARALRDRTALTRDLEKARAVALADLDRHWEKLCASIAPAAQTSRASRAGVAVPSRRAAVAVPPVSVSIDPLRADGAEVTATARLEGTGLEPAQVFYRFPGHAADPTVLGDGFLLAFLFPAMRLGRDLHIRSTVSPSLVENLGEFQRVWECWRPATYRRVQITADALAERPPAGERVSLFGFSSGVDSSYTACKLNEEGRRAAGAMVHGFNIPVCDRESGAALHEVGARILASRGIELVPVATNWRDAFPELAWGDVFGTMVAAVLTILSGRFSDGLIAADHDVRRAKLAWGSNPVTDPLLGSARFPIRQHGGEVARLAKLAAVATWPEAFDALHVCWVSWAATNCGRCPRCLILGAACIALGLPRPRSLPDQPFQRSVFDASHRSAQHVKFAEDSLRVAAFTGAKDPRLAEVARVVKRWRPPKRGRLGDLVAESGIPRGDRWTRLARRVDGLTGGTSWRQYLRPAIRAIRRRK